MTSDLCRRLADALDLAALLHGACRPPPIPLSQAVAALRSKPDPVADLLEQARTHYAQRDLHAALDCLDQALAQAPGRPDALANRGLVLVALRRWQAACDTLQQALARAPDHVLALLSLGDALLGLERPAEALAQFDRAIALQPDLPKAHGGRATALNELDRLEEALASLRQARMLDTPGPGAEWNEALIHLALGDYAAGWRGFEYRWDLPKARADRPALPQPNWVGDQPLAGRTILQCHEQGMGDSLQFCRYAPLLADQGATVLLWVPRPLLRIMRSLRGVSQVVAADKPPPPNDFWCMLMSLPLARLAPLAAIPGISFVSLQKGEAAAEQARHPPAGMVLHD